MRLLLHEWCCSGGLFGKEAASIVDPDAPASHEPIIREGRTMLEALCSDAARDPTLDVTVLVDASRPFKPSASAQRVEVTRGHEIDALVAAARETDWTIIVAPETAGILESRVAAVRSAGGRVLAPGAAFLAVAADKQATIDALAAAGVAVPAGRSLAPLAPLPSGFHMPAVRKARTSVGGDGLVILRSPDVAPSPDATRLEAFVAGTAVGVGVLCGPDGLVPLPPMRQRWSAGDRPRYLGSEPACRADGAERAVRLAERAVAAVTRAAAARDPGHAGPCGWVGVDMILGARDDAGGDVVLEINPRLTTSFAGMSAGQDESLVKTMLAMAAGCRDASADRRNWKAGVAFTID